VQPHRRTVLLGGAAALTAACTSHRTRSPQPPDPDVALTAAAVAREQALLAAYDTALAHTPTALLTRLRDEHAAHLQALGGAPGPTQASTPATALVTRADLVRLERSTGALHAAAALTATRRLAPLLASLAAAEASHVVVL
jgi:hypothetical protein